MPLKFVVGLFSFFMFFGCQNVEVEEIEIFDPTILDEKILDSNGVLIPEMGDSASALYFKSYKLLGSDSLAPYHLMKSADIQRNIPGKALMAIQKYYILKNTYPQHELAAPALFMMGLTFDQNLHDSKRAAKVYQDFVNNYPQHKMATQAQDLLLLALDTTQTDLEMVHQWENNN